MTKRMLLVIACVVLGGFIFVPALTDAADSDGVVDAYDFQLAEDEMSEAVQANADGYAACLKHCNKIPKKEFNSKWGTKKAQCLKWAKEQQNSAFCKSLAK